MPADESVRTSLRGRLEENRRQPTAHQPKKRGRRGKRQTLLESPLQSSREPPLSRVREYKNRRTRTRVFNLSLTKVTSQGGTRGGNLTFIPMTTTPPKTRRNRSTNLGCRRREPSPESFIRTSRGTEVEPVRQKPRRSLSSTCDSRDKNTPDPSGPSFSSLFRFSLVLSPDLSLDTERGKTFTEEGRINVAPVPNPLIVNKVHVPFYFVTWYVLRGRNQSPGYNCKKGQNGQLLGNYVRIYN